MRNLTIERRKKFSGSAIAVKFYIEDAENEEVRIEQTPCRKLGELKNGETKTFSISTDSAKLFAIHDKLSKEYCNDSYQLPTSPEDIYLSGEARVNPGIGNTFIFDGSTAEPLTPKKKRGRIIGWIVLFIAILVGSIAGRFTGNWIGGALFSDDKENVEPKTFTAEAMSITLNENFSEEELENFTVCYGSRREVVICLKEPFTLLAGSENYTLEQYGQLVLQTNGMTDFQVQTQDGITYFEYESETDQGTFYYLCTLHKATDAFWMIQFAVDSDEAEAAIPDFFTWAKSVSFSA